MALQACASMTCFFCRYCPDEAAAVTVNGTTGCSLYFLGRLYDGVFSKRRGVSSAGFPKPKLHLKLDDTVRLNALIIETFLPHCCVNFTSSVLLLCAYLVLVIAIWLHFSCSGQVIVIYNTFCWLWNPKLSFQVDSIMST